MKTMPPKIPLKPILFPSFGYRGKMTFPKFVDLLPNERSPSPRPTFKPIRKKRSKKDVRKDAVPLELDDSDEKENESPAEQVVISEIESGNEGDGEDVEMAETEETYYSKTEEEEIEEEAKENAPN